jgi:hypothetical protein
MFIGGCETGGNQPETAGELSGNDRR